MWSRWPAVLVLAIAAWSCGDPPVVGKTPTCPSCGLNASCVSADDGTKQCKCDAGFAGDGQRCTRVPDAAVCATCSADATCAVGSDGKTACTCNDGFRGDGHSCVAVLDPTVCGGCAANASCEKGADGTPRCVCNQGLVGDGKDCEPATSCDDHHGGCHAWATCEMVGSSPRCTCAFGTTGNGWSCTPPAGAIVRVKGSVAITYQQGTSTCQAAWEVNVPLMSNGSSWSGAVNASVWSLSATTKVSDAASGSFSETFSMHAWQNVGTCTGDFLFSATMPDDGRTWSAVPGATPLSFFGQPIAWVWTSTNGASVTSFSGAVSANFETP